MIVRKCFKWFFGLLENLRFSLFFSYVGVLFGISTVLRFIESILFQLVHHRFIALFRYEVLGLVHDYIVGFVLSSGLLLVYCFFLLIKKTIPKFLFVGFSVFYFLLSVLLIQYYMYGLVPLDAVFLNYTLSEVLFILRTSIVVDLSFFIGLLVVLLLVVAIVRLHRFFPNKIFASFGFFAYFFSALLLIYRGGVLPETSHFANGIQYNTSINKTAYFVSKLCAPTAINERDTLLTIFDVHGIQKNYANARFINDSFPFLRERDSVDVLSPFFTLNEKKPNIVLVVTESLSASFSGSAACLGSYTPFLDSLAANGLYWSNCLSTSERTINALPAILGSLPYAKGFMSLNGDMPYHQSLISILKKSGYYCNFFYSGDISFDNMDGFLTYQGFDTIVGGSDGNTPDGSFAWGKDDKVFFLNSINTITKQNSKPRIDVYLTLSMHGPFTYAGQTLYKKRYNQRKKQVNPSCSDFVISNGVDDLCASAMYDDDAFRELINSYRKLPDFENTIFVIVGDHSHSLVAPISDIEKYHIPLIIYSPMIKTHRHFKSVVSHLDIAPSLLQMLENKGFVEPQSSVHWLGTCLDTSIQFRSNKRQAFLNIGRELTDYIYDTLYFSNNRLYRITDNLQLKILNNQTLNEQLSKDLSIFRKVNYYVCNQNRINTRLSKEKILWRLGVLNDSSVFRKVYNDLPYVPITGEGGEYKITLRGEMKLSNTEHIPLVILRPYDKMNNAIINLVGGFHTIDWSPILPNRWQLVQVSHVVKLRPGKGAGGVLFSFLWNPMRVNVKYRNMVVTITKR